MALDLETSYKSDAQEELIASGSLTLIAQFWGRLRLEKIKQTPFADSDLSDEQTDKSHEKYVLWYQLQRTTDVFNVGNQLWAGGLLLMDYLLSQQLDLSTTGVIELGCGAGLASMLAAQLGAPCVIATDVGTSLLTSATESLDRNGCHDTVLVRELDWCRHETLEDWLETYSQRQPRGGDGLPLPKRHKQCRLSTSQHALSYTDLDRLLRCPRIVVLAADGT